MIPRFRTEVDGVISFKPTLIEIFSTFEIYFGVPISIISALESFIFKPVTLIVISYIRDTVFQNNF